MSGNKVTKKLHNIITACSLQVTVTATVTFVAHVFHYPPPSTRLCNRYCSNKHTHTVTVTVTVTARRRSRFQSLYTGPAEEEDLFMFNDTIEGPRAPVVKPRRVVTQACLLLCTLEKKENSGILTRIPFTVV